MEHDERAEELERELEDMEHRSDEVKRELDETRQNWESRQHDEAVPGAVTEESQAIPAAEEDPDEDEDEGA